MNGEYTRLVEETLSEAKGDPKKGDKVTIVMPKGTYDGKTGVITKITRKKVDGKTQVTYDVVLDLKGINIVVNPEDIKR